MDDTHPRRGEEDKGVHNLLSKLPHEIEGHAAEMGVADEIVEVEGKELED